MSSINSPYIHVEERAEEVRSAERNFRKKYTGNQAILDGESLMIVANPRSQHLNGVEEGTDVIPKGMDVTDLLFPHSRENRE